MAWYMTIDMPYYILTPIFLTMLWHSARTGYALFAVLLAGDAGCQMYFTYDDDG